MIEFTEITAISREMHRSRRSFRWDVSQYRFFFVDGTDARAQSCDYFLSHSSPGIPTRGLPSSRMNDRRGDVDTRSSISWRHVGGDSGARRSCYDRATVMWPIGTRHNRHRQRDVRCMLWPRAFVVSRRVASSRLVSRSRRRQGPSVSQLDRDFAENCSLDIFVEFLQLASRLMPIPSTLAEHILARDRLAATAIAGQTKQRVRNMYKILLIKSTFLFLIIWYINSFKKIIQTINK